MAHTGETFKYFAFGSNLLRERILINNPSARIVGVGKLKGYRLDFDVPEGSSSRRWLGAGATIIEADSSSQVYGVIWDIDVKDLENLDRQERSYTAVQVGVELVSLLKASPTNGADAGKVTEQSPGEVVHCRTYQMTKGTGDHLPSPHYKDVILMGARQNHLPEDYIAFLENFPDNKVTETPPAYLEVMALVEKARGSDPSGLDHKH